MVPQLDKIRVQNSQLCVFPLKYVLLLVPTELLFTGLKLNDTTPRLHPCRDTNTGTKRGKIKATHDSSNCILEGSSNTGKVNIFCLTSPIQAQWLVRYVNYEFIHRSVNIGIWLPPEWKAALLKWKYLCCIHNLSLQFYSHRVHSG